jgi:hypothetical protein
MTADELMQLLKAEFEYSMSLVHTSFPGVVVSYDPNTRRADIQPSLKKRLPNGSFMEPAIIHDVPVRYPGSKKYTIHFPLEEGDEVDVTVCERATDSWRDTGGKGIEDTDPRRFSLNDCYCSPGLQPVEFIAVKEDGFNIVHKTGFDGDFISSVTMDDTKVEVKYKEKADVLVKDDYIKAKTQLSSLEMDKGKILQKSSDADIKSDAPVGINDGLYKTGLSPYLTAEDTAAAALAQAAGQAAPPLAILDALSGGTGFITGLGVAIIAYCTAMKTADAAAHTAIAKAVK